MIGTVPRGLGSAVVRQVVYFTGEGEARKGEQADASTQDAALMARIGEIMQVERYIDLREPLLTSTR